MSSVASKTLFDTFLADPLGLIMTYSGNDEEMKTIAAIFRNGKIAIQNANGALYNNFQNQPATFMARIRNRVELDNPDRYGEVSESYSIKLQILKERAIRCLSQNKLLMHRFWAPVLKARQIGELSYHEWNELGRLQAEELPRNELFMRDIWAPVLKARQIGELSFPERDELEWRLQERRDRDLVAFAQRLSQHCPFISTFLYQIKNLPVAIKAERLRSWMITDEIKVQLAGIGFNQQIQQVFNEGCPPEAAFYLAPAFGQFGGYLAIMLSSLYEIGDVAGIVYLLSLDKSAPMRFTAAKSLLELTLNRGDLPMFLKLRESNVFADLDQINIETDHFNLTHPDPGIIAVLEVAIELPSVGIIFLLTLLSLGVFNREWESAGKLLDHPKAEEFSTKPLPAVFRANLISALDQLRDICEKENQADLALRFQDIIDLRTGQGL